MSQSIQLDPQAVREGLGWAQSWASGPILCVLSPDALRFVVVNDRRFIASWEWQQKTDFPHRFFLIPPFIAKTLASHIAYHVSGLRVQIDRTHIVLFVTDPHGQYAFQWRWQADTFAAPPFFELMSRPPSRTLAEKTFIAIADAVHLAIANLGRLEALEQINRANLAIMVDFSPGQFRINGQPITLSDEKQYYFDPRLIMRGLEVVRGKHIGFALTETGTPGQSILYMTSRRDQWRVQCALQSILPDANTRILSHQARELPGSGRLQLRRRLS